MAAYINSFIMSVRIEHVYYCSQALLASISASQLLAPQRHCIEASTQTKSLPGSCHVHYVDLFPVRQVSNVQLS